MDKNNEIPKDMVEQLLKYVPSQEETALLDEHSQKLDEMARADRSVGGRTDMLFCFTWDCV